MIVTKLIYLSNKSTDISVAIVGCRPETCGVRSMMFGGDADVVILDMRQIIRSQMYQHNSMKTWWNRGC